MGQSANCIQMYEYICTNTCYMVFFCKHVNGDDVVDDDDI